MINWYKDRVCLNVLAKDLDNAKDVFNAAEGHVLVGLLSANYDSVESAVVDVQKHQEALNNHVSIGLGAGDPNQWKMVGEICEQTNPLHANQVFSAVGYTRTKAKELTFINSLVSPSGKVGYLRISTGPLSRDEEAAIVPIQTAIAMIKEMGGNSLKFFPMKGLTYKEEYIEVAKMCAKNDFALEPTGGIDLGNFEEIVQIAVDQGVPKIIPHVYSSIIDDDGNTKVEQVRELFDIIKKIVR